jgi:single-strand DNA-binding protein
MGGPGGSDEGGGYSRPAPASRPAAAAAPAAAQSKGDSGFGDLDDDVPF